MKSIIIAICLIVTLFGCQTDNALFWKGKYENLQSLYDSELERWTTELKECKVKNGPDIHINLPAIMALHGEHETVMNSVFIGGVTDEQMKQIKKEVLDIASHPERYKTKQAVCCKSDVSSGCTEIDSKDTFQVPEGQTCTFYDNWEKAKADPLFFK